ncbi:MAG: hypothetical protein IJS01_09095 [Lentisphaeria bacterium]|nr:hypothetical protein [Lentisphaeria bacterium]
MVFCSSDCFCSEAARKCFSFLVWPEFLEFFSIRSETVDRILQNDFNCGYVAAILSVVILLLALLFLRLILWLIFRTKRCSTIVVRAENGDLIVTRRAVESVARTEVESFPQIFLRKLLIFRHGKIYSMKLFCRFERGSAGMPEIAADMRQRLTEVMMQQFGIDSLKEITICVERLKETESGPVSTPGPEEPPADYSHVVSGF